ncbi:hypothetical protein MUK42_02285 [Musa troglodytarum]|uniref:histidine kinase n=1 Tax=Musa troglodytarum TaxID=320322 RepID=A0A9E7ES67_9LILI|nr:hypothetical protein MUK42_02285 [Musa troglodytarum]
MEAPEPILSCKELMELEAEYFSNAVPFKGFVEENKQKVKNKDSPEAVTRPPFVLSPYGHLYDDSDIYGNSSWHTQHRKDRATGPCVTPRLWILSNYAVNCDRKVPSSDPSDGPYHGVTIGGDPIPCRRTFWPHDTGGTLPLSLVGQKGRIRETCYKPRNSLCSRRVLSVERRRRRRLRRRHGNAPTGAASFPFSYDLSVKTRELFLKNKAEELDREMGLIRTQEETGRHVRMLTHEIRSTLDRDTILKTTLVELGRTLGLEECALWMPSHSARKWHVHELELVEVVADQVAVALSHAAILEESMRARDLLMEQNVALDYARQEAELAIRARNDFLAVMNHEMRTPLHAIITLSSLLLETELNPEQRSMVETVLKSSSLLATLINDILDLSKLEDGSLELEIGTFNLHSVFREVVNFIKPIAAVKKLSVSLMPSPDLPLCATGDEKRLMQILLNIVGNAVKFTKEGHIALTASVARTDYLRDFRAPEFYPASSDGHFYLRVQVKDTGCGISPQDLPHLFTKFAQGRNVASRGFSGSGLGLAICKRYVSLMQGHIWLESEGIGKGCMATFVVKLGICENPDGSQQKIVPLPWAKHGQEDTSSSRGMPKDPKAFIPLKPRYQRSV